MTAGLRQVAAGAALVLLTGCSPAPGSAESIAACQELAAVDHPRLVAVAEDALEGVAYSLQRGGTCEDTGSPSAIVRAAVGTWRKREEGLRHLQQRGWIASGGGLTSPDGGVRATSLADRLPGQHRSFVVLSFFLAE